MKKDKVSTKVVPDIRRVMKGGQLPLKLRVTYKGRRKYYSTGHSVTPGEWELLNLGNAKGKLRSVKNDIALIERDADRLIERIVPFSFKKFEDEFFEKPIRYSTLEAMFKDYILKLEKNGQYGTADSYTTALNSLLKFNQKLTVHDISIDFLKEYEKSMLTSGKSSTTIGIYLRPLRSILNQAKAEGIIKPEQYPFGIKKYTIPSGRNIKKALNIEEVNMFFSYPTLPNTNMDMAKDFWIFTYLCNGINMMDIGKLKWKNLDKTTITFEREKTKNSQRNNSRKIVAIRNEYINAIIEKYGNDNRHPESYVFNILALRDDDKTARVKIKQFTKVINKWTKKIGADLGFESKTTTYGAPIELASQSLGHTNLLTTQKYFAGFDIEMQSKFVKGLTNFTKTK
jgi:integrase